MFAVKVNLTMHRIRLIFLFLLVVLTTSTIAQAELDISKSISTYRDSVYHSLMDGKAASVEVRLETIRRLPSLIEKHYDRIDTNHYYFLSLDEIETIYLLQNNFDGLLYIIDNHDFEINKRRYRNIVSPNESETITIPKNTTGTINDFQRNSYLNYDSLAIHQGNLLTKWQNQIKGAIHRTSYPEETKSFLVVFLNYKIAYHLDAASPAYYNLSEEEIDTLFFKYHGLNESAQKAGKAFIDKYPNSKRVDFIKRFILIEYEIKKFAFGFEFSGGSMIPDRGLSYHLWPSFHAFLGPKLYYQNFFMNLNFGIGAHIGKNEFLLDTLWNGASNVTGSIELGYAIDLGKRFSISPVVGARNIWNFAPSKSRFTSQSPWCFGMEFNLGSIGKKPPNNLISPNLFAGRERSGFHLKVLYQAPKYHQIIPELDGGLWTVTLGLNIAVFQPKID